MARRDLERIKEHLEYADDHQKAARRIAESVGDEKGASEIREAEEKTHKVRKKFDKDL